MPSLISIFSWHFWCNVTYLFKISAMVPEYWLTEGGQSATGALLDHIVESHLASPLVANRAASQGIFFFFTSRMFHLNLSMF